MPPRYENLHPHPAHGISQILRWKLGLGPREDQPFSDAHDTPAPSVAADLELIHHPDPGRIQATWLGHGSWLVQIAGRSILIDPIFSDYCSPLPLPGMRRLQPPGMLPAELPGIDAILLTHSHYDHLDLPSLRQVPGNPHIVLPTGHLSWMEARGFTNVAECAWHESVRLADPLIAHAVPAQHFTARTLFDRNRGHWCGWVIEAGDTRVYFAGDTGYAPIFEEIGRRFGPPDLAVIPIGAYAPRWVMKPMHVNPPEAVRMHGEVQARCSAASHWGTFRLTDEPMGEPPVWLAAECASAGLAPACFRALSVGETLVIGG
jgi:N-acyl-phosphatidylethanolamine-hydrolysing phospholipase D